MQDRLPRLAESFSDPKLHTGTVYKVTNWTALGHTAGFGRQARATLVRSAESDRHRADYYFAHGRAKRLWVHELRKDARTALGAWELAEEHAGELTAWMQAVDGSLPRTLAFDGKDIDGGKLGAIVTLAHHRDGTPAALIAVSGVKADSELPARSACSPILPMPCTRKRRPCAPSWSAAATI